MTQRVAQTARSTERDETRDYLMEMIDQLARLAQRNGEGEIAIHLKAILAAERMAERRRPA